MRIWNKTYIAAALICLTGAVAMAQPAVPASPLVLNIPAQPIGDALNEFGRQSGLHVVLYSKLGKDITSRKLEGTFSAKDALEKLLADTGLRYEYLDEKTVAIKGTGKGKSSGAMDPAGQMRMASSEGSDDKSKPSVSAESSSDKNSMVVRDLRDKPAPFSTGNLDLTRSEDDILPFQVFTAREIELSGASSLQEFLRNRLSQNFSTAIPEENDGGALFTDSRASEVDMRGWGASETVYLLNGRRMSNEYQGLANEIGNSTPNLRSIPVSSIERIEILSSAGSAIYGANATGGVINIITRQDFQGGQLSVSYATPTDANTPRRDVQMNYGFAVHPRVSMNLGAGFGDSEPLRVADRSAVTIERWRSRELARDPTSAGSFALFGARPNIRVTAPATGDLFPDLPGQQINATPVVGYAGGDGLANFEPNANLNLAEGTAGNKMFARGSLLGPETASMRFNFATNIRLGESWSWTIDSRYARTRSEGRPDASLSFIGASVASVLPRVPGVADINPFGQDVNVRLVDPNLDRPELRNKPATRTWSVSTTLHGALGEWRGFVDLSYSQNESNLYKTTFREPAGGWRAAFLSGSYNPFVDVSRVAPASPEFYERYTMQKQYFDSATRNYAATAKVSGPLLRLPAGALQLTGGLETSRTDRYRSSDVFRYEDSVTGEVVTPVGTSAYSDFNPRRLFVFDSYAAYTEMAVPLIATPQEVPLINELELFASGRLDYNVSKGFRSQSIDEQQNGVSPAPVKYTHSTYLYALGFRYVMFEGMAWRLSRSIGFKPPYLDAVMPESAPVENCCLDTTALTDPVRNEPLVLTPEMYLFGGNPDLKAESTVSTNLGLVLMPKWWRDFRISVDYVENIPNDAIYNFGPYDSSVQQAFLVEDAVPGVVSRDPPDGDPSGVGPVRFIDLRYRNFMKIASKSVDLNVMQGLSDVGGGRLSLSISASRNLSYKMQNSSSGPLEEQLRRGNAQMSQAMVWNGNAQLGWEGQSWVFGWNARYHDNVFVPESLIPYQGGDRARWALDHDLNVSYRGGAMPGADGLRQWLSGMSVTLTVQNVFNRDPRYYYLRTDYGVAPGDSIAGRVVTLGVRKEL